MEKMIEVSFEEEFVNHNEKYITEASPPEHSVSPCSPMTDGISGDPLVLPRLGDQYQVEIPRLLSEAERLRQQSAPVDNVDNIDFDFYMGKELAVPILWVSNVAEHVGHVQEHGMAVRSVIDQSMVTIGSSRGPEVSLDNVNSSHTAFQMPECKAEFPDDQLEKGTMSACLKNLESSVADNLMEQSGKTGSYIPLPDSPKAPWNDSDLQSFLLGLYIFGKNLVQVQRFVENKDMGDALSYYYGIFYRSDAHRRWVECRKIRGRKCIVGHRIFTGWRQQEILSRLLCNRGKEVGDTLLEVTRAFNEGTASLEEYVHSLKAIVGKDALVEAIGIGKGKEDLTGIIVEPNRTNNAAPSRPEIPVGKACSSLTSGEIVKFLTGDFRLSKAKSNDLFWEAVWPRLLARGWHSEQPRDISAASRNSLVFLIPGIKKFSRRKLTKGSHYFDSVSDVLNRVAADPKLLDLAEESSAANDDVEADDTKVVLNGPSDHQRPSYLRPRLPDCNSELMKFTIVDTSLAQGGPPSKVRELRSLPADVTSGYRPSHQGATNSDSCSDQSSSGDSSLDSRGESDQSLSNRRKSTSVKTEQSSLSDYFTSDPQLSLHGNGHDLEGHCGKFFNDKPLVKGTKYQLNRRIKSGDHDPLAPPTKRQRLISCKSVGTGPHINSVPNDNKPQKGKEHLQAESSETNKAAAIESMIPLEEAIWDVSQEKSQPRTLIDLNAHPEDFDSEGSADMEVESSQDDLKLNEPLEGMQHPDDHFQASDTNVVLPDDQQPINGRRQSTRNRPPTAKALEALACGFLGVKKEKGTKTSRSGNFTSRSARRARKNNQVSLAAPDTNVITSNVGLYEDLYHRTTSQAGLFDNSHSERKETNELLGVL